MGVHFFRFILLIFCSLFVHFSNAQERYPVVPRPLQVTAQSGNFLLSSNTVILHGKAGARAAESLQAFIYENYHLRLRIVRDRVPQATRNVVSLVDVGQKAIAPEGYELNITAGGIRIDGTQAGLFYGIQTLIQLLLDQRKLPVNLPCGVIKDEPRFAYRGFMLDVSRHFSTVDEIKELLTLMSQHKMNRFHWHLTDNQAWRIEIKKYPKLTSVGATGNHSDPTAEAKFYTQDQIREVVAFAEKLNITIVPEIEMPAHSKAALTAYPELRCESANAPELAPNAPHFTVFCASDATFTFLENVLSEVIALFPGEYIHIGGDEANKIPWKQSAFSQKLIRELDLEDEHGLQSYFIKRIEKFVNSKGRSIIGWDEILEGGLAPNATVMSWQGEQGGIAAAKQQHKVIMTPRTSGLYFDFPQSAHSEERFISLLGTLKNVYDYNPIPKSLTEAQQRYILGVQANLWTERLPTRASRTYMMYPRLFALAETGWTASARKDYEDFNVRLSRQLAYIDRKGINYRVPTATVDTSIVTDSISYELAVPFKGTRIYYTLDGKMPTDRHEEYVVPIIIKVPENTKKVLKTMVVTPYGRRSLVSTVTFENPSPKTSKL